MSNVCYMRKDAQLKLSHLQTEQENDDDKRTTTATD